MRMLELGAINLDAGACIAKQSLRHGFDDTCLTRSGWPQEQQVTHRTARRIQAGQKHLIDFDDLLDRCILPHNAAAQGSIEFSRIVAAAVRIQHSGEVRSHAHRIAARQLPGRSSLSWRRFFGFCTAISETHGPSSLFWPDCWKLPKSVSLFSVACRSWLVRVS